MLHLYQASQETGGVNWTLTLDHSGAPHINTFLNLLRERIHREHELMNWKGVGKVAAYTF